MDKLHFSQVRWSLTRNVAFGPDELTFSGWSELQISEAGSLHWRGWSWPTKSQTERGRERERETREKEKDSKNPGSGLVSRHWGEASVLLSVHMNAPPQTRAFGSTVVIVRATDHWQKALRGQWSIRRGPGSGVKGKASLEDPHTPAALA